MAVLAALCLGYLFGLDLANKPEDKLSSRYYKSLFLPNLLFGALAIWFVKKWGIPPQLNRRFVCSVTLTGLPSMVAFSMAMSAPTSLPVLYACWYIPSFLLMGVVLAIQWVIHELEDAPRPLWKQKKYIFSFIGGAIIVFAGGIVSGLYEIPERLTDPLLATAFFGWWVVLSLWEFRQTVQK